MNSSWSDCGKSIPKNMNHWKPEFAPGENEENTWMNLSLKIHCQPVTSGSTTVHFSDLERELCQLISQHSAAVGCVAWLTNEKILSELAKLKACSILVQKEDFLRPEVGSSKQKIHSMYSSLREGWRYEFGYGAENLSIQSLELPAVRCVGNHNSEKKISHPRMHNKFLVVGEWIPVKEKESVWDEEKGCDAEIEIYENNKFQAKAVWTGSFNFTYTGSLSFENAIVLRDPVIVAEYAREWARILSFSEPLNWERPWSEPEWRIGT